MKISVLNIKNFRGIEEISITPKHLNVFTGPCGTGKTSILRAINFAITGEIKNEDIRKNQKMTEVELIWEDGSSLKRSRSNGKTTVKCNGKTTSQKSLNEFIKQKLGTSVANYEAVCNADFFTAINKNDLSNLFQSILPVTIDFTHFCTFADSLFIKPLSTEEKAFLQQYFPADPETFEIRDMDLAYKKCYEERAAVNAVIKNLRPKCEFDDSLPKESKEKLQKRLYELAEKEAEVKFYQNALRTYENSQKQFDAREQRKKN